MKTYYVEQVPVESIVFLVVDETNTARDLSSYTSASVFFTDPDGLKIAGGEAIITDSAKGKVTYTFPSTSVFSRRGEYKVQLRLGNSNRADYTDILSIKVLESLEVTA